MGFSRDEINTSYVSKSLTSPDECIVMVFGGDTRCQAYYFAAATNCWGSRAGCQPARFVFSNKRQAAPQRGVCDKPELHVRGYRMNRQFPRRLPSWHGRVVGRIERIIALCVTNSLVTMQGHHQVSQFSILIVLLLVGHRENACGYAWRDNPLWL